MALTLGYQHFSVEVSTPMRETGSTYEFAVAPNRDLYGISKSGSGTNKTEVHVWPASSGYGEQSLHFAQLPDLWSTDETFQFALAPNLDLYAINKSRTGTGRAEVHAWSAASKYQDHFVHESTALPETDGSFYFLLASNLDLLAVQLKSEQIGPDMTRVSVEVTVLTEASNYTAIALQTTVMAVASHWGRPEFATYKFALSPNRDLYVIRTSGKPGMPPTNVGSELTIYSSDSGYRDVVFKRPLPLGDLFGGADSVDLALAPDLDLFVIKKSGTPSGAVEVRVLSRFDIADLGDIGLPFIDGNEQRIWSIREHKIQYSDDYGDTWTEWCRLSLLESPEGTLFRDSRGNFYYNADGLVAKVDAVTQQTDAVITFAYSTDDVAPPDQQKIPGLSTIRFRIWGITEDKDGFVYVGQYAIANRHDGVVIPCAYIWKVAPPEEGSTLTRIDYFVNPSSDAVIHVHGIKCSPYNGRLYITVGDGVKDFYVSADKLASHPSLIAGPKTGYTGLTFTWEGVYTSDDQAPGGNSVWLCADDEAVEEAYTLPSLYNTQTYCLRASGDTELWVTNDELGDGLTRRTGVHRLVKGPNDWSFQPVLSSSEGDGYQFISEDGRGCVPETHPFVYVTQTSPRRVIRICRR